MFSLPPPRHISTLPKAPFLPTGRRGRNTPMTGPAGRAAPVPPVVVVPAAPVTTRMGKMLWLSFNLLNQHARLSHQNPQLPAFLDGLARMQPVLQCVFVAAWSARPRRAAVHATTSFPGHGRRHAGLARPCLGAATRARQHRTGVARMLAGHLLDLRCAGIGTRSSSSPMIGIGAIRASVSAGREGAAFCGAGSRGD